ncbi:DASH family cryptochrome [Christiangramia sp. SM2212]|uniref:Cryptochrome DASH n=1 Tax=Christiangramia sediminicola TaxID=3073267 RepID=A0ABU1ERR9_9FLAO|nr:DASH family cryptochrome [Christiangramia sp. SM2212]MDR5591080.1 DASH family cryptochrome [Christiangramia sp. SM2212]
MSTGLVWFRNDLRVSDNEALESASRENDKIIGVYCFDPRQFEKTALGFPKTGKFRAKFLIESIEELKQNLESLNITLLIYLKKPEEIIPEIAKKHQVSTIYFQKEWTQEEKDVENALKESIPSVEFKSYYQQFLYHPEDIPFKSFDEIPRVFTDFRKACEKRAEIRELIDTISPKENSNLIDNNTSIPGLEKLGLDSFEEDSRTAFPYKGGENHAKNRIKKYFWKSENLSEYKETRNGLIGESYSSKLSAWLANGSISAKQIYYEVKKYEKEVKSNQSTYWLIFELLWRDFFKFISLKHGNKIFQLGGILEKDLDWNSDEEKLRAWINGNTKEDFVNANMKEIASTGFMSNRGRQNVNSFWAKELKQDWRIGASYFESMLIDYDVHSNWGNWMYNSGVGNDPRDRKFNIKSQTDRYDPDNEYQDLWLKN